MKTFTAYVEWDPETKLYMGIVPGLTGAHSQGATLDELHANMKEVIELVLAEYGEDLTCCLRLVGLQQVQVTV